MGRVMADYAAGSAESDHGSRSSSRQARIRCHDADEEDRHRCNRGGTLRLTNGFEDDAVGPNKPLQLRIRVECRAWRGGWRWRVPQPAAGDVERVVLWAQVLTGMELASDETAQVVPIDDWRKRQVRLKELGGSPAPEAEPESLPR